jgi:hypothetical protein
MTDFRLIQNYFSGTIPDAWGNMTVLGGIYFSNNFFEGTIPRSLGTIANLSVFYCGENEMTGRIDNIFNYGTLQKRFTQIMVNNNYFTGTLPESILGMPSISTFVASVNCLTGTIPSSVCNSKVLYIFAVDGATTASRCQVPIFNNKQLFSTYTLPKNRLTGTIPNCLYAMPSLGTIHLSGNLLNSKIDDSIVLSPSVTTLVLSHNYITGTIPEYFQSRQWTLLDLSYNRLSGTLSTSFHFQASNGSVDLNINRLSGVIPSSLTAMENITLLDGNIFSCGYYYNDANELPTHDPDYDKYKCGSNEFNSIIIVWIALLSFIVLVFFFVRYRDRNADDGRKSGINDNKDDSQSLVPRRKSIYREFMTFVHSNLQPFQRQAGTEPDTSKHQKNETIVEVGVFFARLRYYSVAITILVTFIYLPTYGSLHDQYSTYTYLYAWTVSSAFVAGQAPGYVLFVLWFLVSTLLFVYVKMKLFSSLEEQTDPSFPVEDKQFDSNRIQESEEEGSDSNNPAKTNDRGHAVEFYFVLVFVLITVLFNMIVVGTVNGCFVYIAITYSNSVVVICEMFMALFKLIWNHFLLRFLANQQLFEFQFQFALRLTNNYLLKFIILITNNILIPIVASSLVSSFCFYNAFVRASSISVNVLSGCGVYECNSAGNCTCIQTSVNGVSTRLLSHRRSHTPINVFLR